MSMSEIEALELIADHLLGIKGELGIIGFALFKVFVEVLFG